MKTIHGIENFPADEASIVTIGTFDGVHLGHQQILKQLIDTSRKSKLKSVLLTFFPHPRMVLQPDISMRLIQTIQEREKALQKTGLDYLVIHPFSTEFSRLSADDYVKQILVEQLNVRKVVVGYDHRFGRNRTASLEDMYHYADIHEFEVIEINAEKIESTAVSSTKIRKAIDEGNIELANTYLGHSFTIEGMVIDGDKRGRELSYPTANIDLQNQHKIVPKQGVYLVKSKLKGRVVYGMMNIGTKPTFDTTMPSIEVHFLDWNGNLYGQAVQVELLKWVREERKFNTVEELQTQIQADEQYCRSSIPTSHVSYK
ncbi:MAG: riboflavin biosynthesis protein RibF [Flavobacteriaceae bacterium]|jgi:riboflavin kinase/FMN adenylyltransferase|nr:riboflavin biosynthesis protein RibF [Flavobacteriaceae bacterium]|tara:strand:- start:1039 stop:1983 length:945 start_codon:yes stop_codon:yes gene_type:complete